MQRNNAVETGRDRTELARDAGFGRISLWSVLAGTLAAYGTFALLLPLVTAIARALGDDYGIAANDWRRLGTGAAIAVALTLLASYLLGGYTAGRMARRLGLLHGLLVFLASVGIATGVGALVNALTDGDALLANLRNLGVPTAADEWREVATVAGLASLAAMLVGSLLGAWRGESWHGRLLSRALDPRVGHEARLRRLAAEADGSHDAAEDRVRRARGHAPAASRDLDTRDTVVVERFDQPTTVVEREQVVVTHEPLADASATTTQVIDPSRPLGGGGGTTAR